MPGTSETPASGTVPGTEQTTRTFISAVDTFWDNSLSHNNPLFSGKNYETQRWVPSNPPLWPQMTVLLECQLIQTGAFAVPSRIF